MTPNYRMDLPAPPQVMRGVRCTMDAILAQKIIISTGLIMDMVGAVFVAIEAVRKFKGTMFVLGQDWTTMSDPPKKTEEYRLWDQSHTRIMRVGLLLLLFGFLLQIFGNWVPEILSVFGCRP